jgi:hypothetical protein
MIGKTLKRKQQWSSEPRASRRSQILDGITNFGGGLHILLERRWRATERGRTSAEKLEK